MATLTEGEWRDKSLDVANDVAKQFIALALGGIAFAIGISGKSPGSLNDPRFWIAIGALGLSAILGFLFLMGAVARMADGKRLDVYSGLPRFLAGMQIILVGVATVVLLLFHIRDVARQAGLSQTKVVIQQGGKDTTLVAEPGKNITISVTTTGELKAEVK